MNNFSEYEFSESYRNVIVENYDSIDINYNKDNYYKVTKLIPTINKRNILYRIFDKINSSNKLSEFIDFCKKNCLNIEFYSILSEYLIIRKCSPSDKKKVTSILSKIRKNKV